MKLFEYIEIKDGKAAFVDKDGNVKWYDVRMHGPNYEAPLTSGLKPKFKPTKIDSVDFDEATKKKSKKPSPTTKRKTKESANPAIDE